VYDGPKPYNHYEPQQDTNNPIPINSFILPTKCIYWFRIFLRVISDYFLQQYYSVYHCNGEVLSSFAEGIQF